MAEGGKPTKKSKTTKGNPLIDLTLPAPPPKSIDLSLPLPWPISLIQEINNKSVTTDVYHNFSVKGTAKELIFTLVVDTNEDKLKVLKVTVGGYLDLTTTPISFVAKYFLQSPREHKNYDPHPTVYLIRTLVPLTVLASGCQYVAKNLEVARDIYGRPPRIYRVSKLYDPSNPFVMVAFKDKKIIELAMADTELVFMKPKEYDDEYIEYLGNNGRNRASQKQYYKNYDLMACLKKGGAYIGAVGFKRPKKNRNIYGKTLKTFEIMGIHSNTDTGAGVTTALLGHLRALADKEDVYLITPKLPENNMREILHKQHGALVINQNDNEIGVPTLLLLAPYTNKLSPLFL